MKKTIDIWAAFLTKYSLLDQKQNELPEAPDYSNLKKALNVISVMNFSDEERNSYEDHLKWLRDETSALNKKYEKGKAEGIKIVVLNMLKTGKYTKDEIKDLAGMSIEEVEKIESEAI